MPTVSLLALRSSGPYGRDSVAAKSSLILALLRSRLRARSIMCSLLRVRAVRQSPDKLWPPAVARFFASVFMVV